MKVLKNVFVLMFLVSLMLLVSCEYQYIEFPAPPPLPPIDTTDTTMHFISFSNVIEPIFTEATCTSCHGGGSNPLNLTVGNAYSSIMNVGAVVAGEPANSLLYTKPNPLTGDHYKKYQQAQADSVYLWIYQGAKNN